MIEQETINIEQYIESLDSEEVSTLEVTYHWEGEDRAQTLTEPAEYAEIEIDAIKCAGYMVDEYPSDSEFEELKANVNHKVRFGDE